MRKTLRKTAALMKVLSFQTSINEFDGLIGWRAKRF